MEDGNGMFFSNRRSGNSKREEDVWSLEKERLSEDSSSKIGKSIKAKDSSGPRMIPRANYSAKVAQESSAPINIPDWSKVYRSENSKKGKMYHGFLDDACDDDDDHDDGSDGEMVPPHEYMAKKLARSQISSFSMCEGIGRTLKGRDLSKVRNAILTKTGFLE
ncbi:hypothetical protein Vadar_017244 [Vaccinium darrowii]|uniref:Uncharacterized protein n=1 Tax=Vaccinium darrowii TaxID=229202 RepID=A0ACB7XAD0_9ERIC|nr:hypothetical protein Vadar_017244 [Vaccinium darrowii]